MVRHLALVVSFLGHPCKAVKVNQVSVQLNDKRTERGSVTMLQRNGDHLGSQFCETREDLQLKLDSS